jgi:UDP-2,3-diacylglucosamine hydrolase
VSRALFVSDIHISSALDPKARLFQRFLATSLSQRVEHLFLVGDIFDLWIADRKFFVDNYAPIIESLRQLKAAGTEIHYFEGNHDLDLAPFWRGEMAFDVREEAATYTLNGVRVRVEHGDQMDPTDRGYLFLRWFLRTGALRFLGRNLPDGWVQRIGQRASSVSRDYTTQVKVATENEVRTKIERHARQVFASEPFDLLVSGHVHVADDREIAVDAHKFRSVNLGTWLSQPLVFELNGADGHLLDVEKWILGHA